MALQQQVCTLEQAKRLEELGCKQSSQCFWLKIETEWLVIHRSQWEYRFNQDEYYRAYTVAELGEMLLKRVSYNGYDVLSKITGVLIGVKDFDFWFSFNREVHSFATEAQARAELLILELESQQEILGNDLVLRSSAAIGSNA